MLPIQISLKDTIPKVLLSFLCNAEAERLNRKHKQMINPILSVPKNDVNQNAESLIWLQSTKRRAHFKMINLITTHSNGFLCFILYQAISYVTEK